MQVGNPEYPLQRQTPAECIAKGFCGCDICPFYQWCDKPEKEATIHYKINNLSKSF